MEHPTIAYTLITSGIVVASLIRAYLDKASRLQGFFRFLGGLEITIISVLLGTLIFFGCLQIVLRNFFHSGLIWADPLMRHTVLWLGCLGAALATTKMRHINIDVFTRFLPPRVRSVRDKIVYLATALAASVLGFAALKLVVDEKAFGEKAFLNVEIWVLQLVLPLAFFLISYRSLLNTWAPREIKPLEWNEFGIETGDIEAGEGDSSDGENPANMYAPGEDGDDNVVDERFDVTRTEDDTAADDTDRDGDKTDITDKTD